MNAVLVLRVIIAEHLSATLKNEKSLNYTWCYTWRLHKTPAVLSAKQVRLNMSKTMLQVL